MGSHIKNHVENQRLLVDAAERILKNNSAHGVVSGKKKSASDEFEKIAENRHHEGKSYELVWFTVGTDGGGPCGLRPNAATTRRR